MEIKSINHHSRRSFKMTEWEEPITDQSMTSDTDINIIVSRYKKTGVMPSMPIQQAAQYFDTTKVASFQDAHNRIAAAKSAFQQLPSQLRALMDNDPMKAEAFFKNPDNFAELEKHGFLTIKEEALPPKTQPEVNQTPQNTPPANSDKTKD